MASVDDSIGIPCKKDGERVVIVVSTATILVTNYGRYRIGVSLDEPPMEREPGERITEEIIMAVRAVANNRTLGNRAKHAVITDILDAFDRTVERDYIEEAVDHDNDVLSAVKTARKQIEQARLHDAATGGDQFHAENARDYALSAIDDYVDIISGVITKNMARFGELDALLR